MKKRSSKAVPTKTHKKKKPVRNKRVCPNKTKRVHQWDNKKEAARLAALGKNFSGGRLFNGYVREALPMLIALAIPIIGFLCLSIFMLHDALTLKLPADLENKTVQVSDIREDENSIYFITDAGTMYTFRESVQAHDRMLESFSPGASFTVTYSKEDPEAMWGIRTSHGKEFLSPDDLLRDLKHNRLTVFWCCIAGLIIYTLFFIAANHVLSNAPKYPRLSRLFVRKEYLNIYDNEISSTQTSVSSQPAAELNLQD